MCVGEYICKDIIGVNKNVLVESQTVNASQSQPSGICAEDLDQARGIMGKEVDWLYHV